MRREYRKEEAMRRMTNEQARRFEALIRENEKLKRKIKKLKKKSKKQSDR